MKTAFVNLNSKYIHSSLAPWYLFSAVKEMQEKEIEPLVIEGTINEQNEAVIKRIEDSKADVLGFSCYIWNIDKVEEIAAALAAKKKAVKIFFGGPEVSYRAEEILTRLSFVDAVISGEGEWPVCEYLKSLKYGYSAKDTEGICIKEGGKIYINPPYVAEDIPPNPYVKEYFESLNGRIAYFESSRGCPFSCAFCLSGRCGGVRYFPFESSFESLIKLANSGTKTIKFVDRTFNAHHERTNRWLTALLNERGKRIPENVCFHFEVAGDLLKEDTLEILRKFPAGMVQLEIGLQSFDAHTLELVTRKTNTDILKNNIRRLLSFQNMHIHLDLIMGLPSEDMTKIRKSFNEAFSLRPHMLQVGFLKLLYGAAMREDEESFPCEYSKKAPYEVISTPYLSAQELESLHDLEDCVERIINSGRLNKTLEHVLDITNMEPFELFMYIGKGLRGKIKAGISFNEYAKELLKLLCELPQVDRKSLRDYMVLDRLETDPSGRIPDFLRVEDVNLRKIKKELNKEEATRSKPGVKRGLAILYSLKKAVYVDYIDKNPITDRFKAVYLDLL